MAFIQAIVITYGLNGILLLIIISSYHVLEEPMEGINEAKYAPAIDQFLNLPF